MLEETEKETQSLNLEKWKRDFPNRGFQGGNDKRFRPNFPPGKGIQPRTGPPKTYCGICGKNHGGKCLYGNVQCYECGEKGHKRSECPKIIENQNRALPSAEPLRPPFAAPRGRPPVFGTQQQARNIWKPQAGGRVYCLEEKEGGDGDPHTVVLGTFIINTVPTKVLFDAGATHSTINPTTAARMTCVFEELDVHLYVTTPIGSMYRSNLRNCMIVIQGKLFFGDLILLGICGYDVILGMDWLTKSGYYEEQIPVTPYR